MRRTLLVLAATLLPAASGLAQDGVLRPQTAPTADQEAEKPAPQLVRLDSSLAKAQEDKRQGRIDEKRYQELLTRFRADLDEAMTSVKPTPPNTALRARILSRLGDSGQALAALGPALEQDPSNPALRVALSQVHYDQKDYPAALAEANAVLAIDPANKAALGLKYSSEGRIGLSGAAPSMDTQGISGGAVTEQFRSPLAKDSPKDYARWQRIQKTIGYINSAKAALLAGRGDEALEWANKAVQTDPTPTAMKFAEEVRKIVDEGKVDEVPYNPKTPAPKDGGMPLWPILPISGLGAAAYVVAKSRKTVESEDGFDEENRPLYGRLQRFVAGAVLAGLAGAGIYLAGASAIPVAARYLAVPGQHVIRLAQSEAGAIGPRSISKAGQAAPRIKATSETSEVLPEIVIKKGEFLNRMWHSEWTDGSNLSGPKGASFCRGNCLPLNAKEALRARGLEKVPGVHINNAQRGGTYRVTQNITAGVRRAIGGVDEEIVIRSSDINKVKLIRESISHVPSGPGE